jgi:hypothetical protein
MKVLEDEKLEMDALIIKVSQEMKTKDIENQTK